MSSLSVLSFPLVSQALTSMDGYCTRSDCANFFCFPRSRSFIIEGAITCFVAAIFYFILPSFPEQAKWLKQDEKDYIVARLRIDQGNAAIERSTVFRDVISTFKDYKVVVAGFMYLGLIVPAYGYAYVSFHCPLFSFKREEKQNKNKTTGRPFLWLEKNTSNHFVEYCFANANR
jgi:hypothetical protein